MCENNESKINDNIFLEENIIRCPICHLIPFISIDHSNKETKINFKCLNDHIISKPLKEFCEENKNNKTNVIKCNKCEEKEISKLNYCIKCYCFYCEKENHSLNEGHNILIPINKLDSYCFDEEHKKNNVNYFCFIHNKNICEECKNFHHIKDKTTKIHTLTKREIKEIQNNIVSSKESLTEIENDVNLYISDLEKLIEEIKREFNIFKENKELEINLAINLINTYQLKKEDNNLNYQIINNIRNFPFTDYNISQFNDLIDILEVKNNILDEIINNNEMEDLNKSNDDSNDNLKDRNKLLNENIKEKENNNEQNINNEIITIEINEENKKDNNKIILAGKNQLNNKLNEKKKRKEKRNKEKIEKIKNEENNNLWELR